MISKIYPNKLTINNKANKRYPTYHQSTPSQQHSTVYPYPQLTTATIHAAKLNITTAEWQRRDAIVRKLADACKLEFMAAFYPSRLEDYKQYGRCLYLGKPRSYAEIDADEWPANDNPLIFHAQFLNAAGEKSNFYCNLEFMQKDAPTV